MDATNKENKKPNPRAKANIFEIITHSWILQLLKKGLKKDLDLVDLYGHLDGDSSALLGNKLQTGWNNELMDAHKKNRKPSFLKALLQVFGTKFLLYGIIHTTSEIFTSIGIATTVGQIVKHFEPNTSAVDHNADRIYLALTLVALLFVKALIFVHFDMGIAHQGMQMRVAICDLIYNKALRLKSNSLDQTSAGQIVNLMTNDVSRFDVSLIYIQFLLTGPLLTIASIYFVWQEVGVSSAIGAATLVAFVPLQAWLGSQTSVIRSIAASKTDERINLMNEIISGLQVIKMYTWEPFFNNLTKFARKKEMNKIAETLYIKGVLSSFLLFNSRLALFVNIFTYVILGNYITASKVFFVTSYYNILKISMTSVFPRAIGQCAEVLVSVKRIQDLLLREENDVQSTNVVVSPTTAVQNNNVCNDRNENEQFSNNCSGIVVTNATAKWTDAQTDNCLENINLTMRPGRLVAIIGPVGAGKSSLIQSILRELPLSEGSISVSGVVSYASQEPWLFAGSVRKNILFGSPMDKKRYKKTIEVCSLKTDLERFPYGDKTIIGERGVSLSGGQRARINLARAVYRKADIYLLDDPLSAVDTHVGKELFENCIKKYLKDKTCVLVTHQIQYLIDVDQIVLMENARVMAEGSYQELQTLALDFTKLLHSAEESGSPDAESKTTTTTDGLANRSVSSIARQLSNMSFASSTGTNNENKITPEPVEAEEETRSTGKISSEVYSSYFFSCERMRMLLGLFFACIATQVLTSGGDYWMAAWVNLEEHVFHAESLALTGNNGTVTTPDSPDEAIPWVVSRTTCVVVLAAITFSIILGAFTETTLLVSVCTRASINLHNYMFNSITRATMGFLNKTPSGRILNRFSKDVGIMDEILPFTLIIVIQEGLSVIGILFIVGIVNYYLILPTMIIVLVFYKMKSIYMTTARNVKRLEGIARSPMFTHVNASLHGLTTIRAFKTEPILSQEFACHQDLHSSAWYLLISLSRAFAFWLDIICILYIATILFFFTLICNDTSRGNIGLIITQILGLTGTLQWLIRNIAELENQMTSVERVVEYTKVPQESALESALDKKPPKEWPFNGRVVFKKFYLRYEADSPFVLKNLNITIEPAEKIGIVGRTGAGKSSFIGALFRLALNEGEIIIDDVEIHSLGLHDLRSKISIIPQEPVLFTGTMRTNLDPFDEHPDHILWRALDEVELKEVVEDLPNGLHSTMSKGGSNFSVGQRQLVCLARAIVRNNKILVLDEATANVDLRTDALIQSTIRNKFRTCTVFTVAHRLNTVIDSDKILVMDNGAVVEFEHPYNLLKNKNGFLYKMVERTGKINADLLHSTSEKVYNNTRIKDQNIN